METTLFKVSLYSGRIFKVFCANKSQKERFQKALNTMCQSYGNIQVEELENGIHTVSQWEQIIQLEY